MYLIHWIIENVPSEWIPTQTLNKKYYYRTRRTPCYVWTCCVVSYQLRGCPRWPVRRWPMTRSRSRERPSSRRVSMNLSWQLYRSDSFTFVQGWMMGTFDYQLHGTQSFLTKLSYTWIEKTLDTFIGFWLVGSKL